jgi:hypothetical protein
VITYLLCRVLETVLDDDRQERAEAVQDCYDSDLNAAVKPALDIFGSFFDIRFSVLPAAAGVGFHTLGTHTHDLLLFVVEEVGRFIVLWYQVDAHEGPNHGDYAFDHVEPAG